MFIKYNNKICVQYVNETWGHQDIVCFYVSLVLYDNTSNMHESRNKIYYTQNYVDVELQESRKPALMYDGIIRKITAAWNTRRCKVGIPVFKKNYSRYLDCYDAWQYIFPVCDASRPLITIRHNTFRP